MKNWARVNVSKNIHTYLITGKSFSEALIFASTNPENDKRLFIDLPVQYRKLRKQKTNNLCTQHVLSLIHVLNW